MFLSQPLDRPIAPNIYKILQSYIQHYNRKVRANLEGLSPKRFEMANNTQWIL